MKTSYFYAVVKHLLNSFAFLFLCIVQLNAQELIFENLSDKVQLPSRECYKIVQDKNGYIWFATDNGLCRYASGFLKVYNEKNGLDERVVFNIEADRNGKLFFLTSNNRILFENGHVLKETAFSKSLQSYSKGRWQHPIPYFLDVSDPKEYYTGNSYYTLSVNPETGASKLIFSELPNVHFNFWKGAGNQFIPGNFKNLPGNKNNLIVQLRNGKKTKTISIDDLSSNVAVFKNTPTCFAGKTDFIAIQNKLLKVNADLSHSVISFPGRILNLYADHSGGLWVAVYKRGVFYYPDLLSMQPAHNSLKEYSVTGICEDSEKGIWCSTLENGIFYCRNSKIISYAGISGLNKPLSLLKYTDGKLMISALPGFLTVGMNKVFRSYPIPGGENPVYDISRKGEKWYLTNPRLIESDLKFGHFKKVFQKNGMEIGQSTFVAAGNRSIILQNHCIMEINGNTIKEIKCGLDFNVSAAVSTEANILITGGKNGLFRFDLTTGNQKKIKNIPEKIVRLVKDNKNRIWIATKNDGLFLMSGEKITKIAVSGQIVLHDLVSDISGNIWAASNMGLYKFVLSGEKYVPELYNVSHGLPSNEVYKVAADNENIWFSTYEGLLSMPLNAAPINKNDPQIYLRTDGGKNIPVIHLPYGKNEKRLTFDVMTFKDESGLKLEYHLKNKDGNKITYVNGNEILLENLAPGKYFLSVYGINNNGVKSAVPYRTEIIVETPFWMTAWFISLSVVILIVLIFLIVRFIVLRIRRKEEAKTRANKMLAEYQITALQAQMNPHFIFNAINTIQGYIFEKNEDQAYDYLAKFSRLIRTVLHHSQEKILSLKNELEMLQLYIELEQMRFDFCFDYELAIGENIDLSEIKIPGMLLQPYVENAIWHGIINLEKKRRGKLLITIRKMNEQLLITVTDNGIGRELAKTFHKDRSHRSAGMQLTGERLKAMNQLYGSETASVEITDLFGGDHKAAGTAVEIIIPITIG